MAKKARDPGKALSKKNAPYPERNIEITEQVYLAAFYTALGHEPGEVARELKTTPHTIYNYRRNKKFLALVRDLEAAGEFEPSLEVRLLMRQTTRAAEAALATLKGQLTETLITDDGQDTRLPQPKIRQDAATKLLEHFGRVYAAQARAVGGGGESGAVVVVNVNPMAGTVVDGVVIEAKEVTDG